MIRFFSVIRFYCCVALLFFSILLTPLVGQEAPKANNVAVSPDIRMVVPSANDFVTDLNFLLATTSQPAQFKVFKDYLDEVFLIGVDFSAPLRLDVLIDDKTYRLRVHLPVPQKQDLKTFRTKNLPGWNTKSAKMRNAKNLYKLRDPARNVVGWMRWREGYAVIGEQQGDVSLKLPATIPEVAELLKKNYDVAIEGKNMPVGIDARHRQFLGTKKELLSTLKINEKTKETKEDFAVRKMLYSHQLDELQRLYAEAEYFLMGWNTDVEKKQGEMDLTLKPLPNTSLEASIKQQNEKPSFFSKFAKTKDPILSARMNIFLDEMRIKYMLETSETFRKREKAQIDLVEETTPEQKTDQKKAWDLVFDILDAGLKKGMVDGAIEVHPNAKNKQTVVGGVQLPDGNAVIPILELFGKVHSDIQPKLKIETIGDVKIHTIQLVKSRHPEFFEMFGDETLILGTSKETVWFAAGENGKAELKAAIELAAKPNAEKTDAPLMDFQVKMYPWVKLIDQRRSSEKAKTKGDIVMRKFALIAFANGNDDLSVVLNKVDNQVKGKLVALPGVLRFIGEMMADFSKNNLESD